MTNTTVRCKGCGEDVELFNCGYCEHCHNVRVFRGYSRAELKDAFERVEDKTNWKNPIDTVLPGMLSGAEQSLIEAAVIFFAGCEPTILPYEFGTRVTAKGYYHAVGA